LKKEIGFEGTLLGVDIWRTYPPENQNQSTSSSSPPYPSGTVITKDANESAILSSLTDTNVVIVSPIGGQGFILGRGNGQISPSVLERCTIKIVGSRAKLEAIDVLRVDTGDPDIDSKIRGWHRIHIGRFETRLIEVV
ncbi:MAG TPA: N-acetylglucosamine-1-phosphate uridyltransferase, partial [Halobacteriales archaeon]|nr:N-acetylglucosamine-1-phosphate uridyltransferase [Halobacteriales archaeon]